MKTNRHLLTFLCLFLGIFAWSCGEDDINPRLEEIRNEAYDLVVISDGSPRVPVSFTASATDLARVDIIITPQGSSTEVARGGLRNIKANNLNRVNMGVDFPGNDVAPSGLYTVSYTMHSKSGEQSFGAYDINIINNLSPVYCDFTSAVPAGKSVWIRLYVPDGESLPDNDNTVYLTGSFGGREGGSDWDGGGDARFAFTRLSPTCYELAVNLQEGDMFKITRGNWDKQMTTATGQDSPDAEYTGASAMQFIAYNWKDRETVTPETPEGETLNIPREAIKPGMLTIVADVANSVDVNAGDFYVVEKGATNLTNAIKMVAFDGENKLAAAVPKKTGVEYIVVQGSAGEIGRNRYGFDQSAVWDGRTNPARVSIGAFGAPAFTLGNKIVIVGGATPGDWGVGAGQDFTRTAPGKYEITIQLNANSEYLLLPDYGQWDDKWAFGSGTAAAGEFAAQGTGGNLTTNGLEAGTYKIEVDFTTGNGTYKLTKL
jgi:hypothetical protein